VSRKIRLPAYRPEVMKLLSAVVTGSGYVHEYCRRITRHAGHEFTPQEFAFMLQDELRSLFRENQFPEQWGEQLQTYLPRIVDVLVSDPDLAGSVKNHIDESRESAI